jgi:hypothetical protein
MEEQAFTIMRLRDGGYIVSCQREYSETGSLRVPFFASAKIGEALEYVREKLEPRAAPGGRQ